MADIIPSSHRSCAEILDADWLSSFRQDLTNIELFLVSKDVEESLRDHDISKCLSWCYDNKSKLRKLKVKYGETLKTGSRVLVGTVIIFYSYCSIIMSSYK